MILATAMISLLPHGNRSMGAVTGLSGVAVVALPFVVEPRSSTLPEFAIPWGLGLLALSYHNYVNLEGADRHRRFRENVYGLNAAAAVALVSAMLLSSKSKDSASPMHFRISLSPHFAGIAMALHF